MKFRSPHQKAGLLYEAYDDIRKAISKREIHVERSATGQINGYVWLKDRAKRNAVEIHGIVSGVRGTCRKLFDWVVANTNRKTIELIVWENNRHAIQVYRHLGFIQTGEKSNCGEKYKTMNYAVS